MAEHDHTPDAHLALLTQQMAELLQLTQRLAVPLAGQMLPHEFNGKEAASLDWTDDTGPDCLSYAVYNPNAFRVAVSALGAGAGGARAFVVPKQKLVVAPIQVAGDVHLAANAEDIGEASGLVWRVRFPTPQPFFVGALA